MGTITAGLSRRLYGVGPLSMKEDVRWAHADFERVIVAVKM
jgi:hypothetical protein